MFTQDIYINLSFRRIACVTRFRIAEWFQADMSHKSCWHPFWSIYVAAQKLAKLHFAASLISNSLTIRQVGLISGPVFIISTLWLKLQDIQRKIATSAFYVISFGSTISNILCVANIVHSGGPNDALIFSVNIQSLRCDADTSYARVLVLQRK